MDSESRACRVCMQVEGKEKFQRIFGENSEKALDIFLVSGIKTVDYKEVPALICKTCVNDLSNAVKFRNQCRFTDSHLKAKLLPIETKQWAEAYELPMYKTNPLCEVDMPVTVKTEPIDNYEEQYEGLFGLFDYESSPAEDDDGPQRSIKKKSVAKKSTPKRKRQRKKECYTCHVCFSTVLRKDSLKRHMRRKHGIENYSVTEDACPYCMQIFDSVRNLKEHIRVKHEEGREFTCDECGKSFETKRKLAKHVQVRTNEMPCPTCGKIFKNEKRLRAHEKYHRVWLPEDYYYCDKCGNKFKEKGQLCTHLKNKHILKTRYTCEWCPGRTWIKKASLNIHVKVYHLNIKEFKCEWCGKDFGEKRKLMAHIRIHTGEQPFQCNVCGIKFTHETDYRRHKWTHEGIKGYRCQICDERFYKRSEMISHRNRHTERQVQPPLDHFSGYFAGQAP